MKTQIPWLRVFVEGVVIVGSILLAFGIDAWWDGVQERGRERESLELLSRDLAETAGQGEEFVAFADVIVESALSAYQALSGPRDEINEHAASDYLAQLGIRRTVRVPSAAFTDMLSTGSLRVIRDRDLRDEVVQFYEAAHRTQDIIDQNNRVFIDGFLLSAYVGEGLVVPRPTGGTGLSVLDESDEFLRARLGQGFPHLDDRIWSLQPDSPEWHGLRNALLAMARITRASRTMAYGMTQNATRLHEAIQTELAR